MTATGDSGQAATVSTASSPVVVAWRWVDWLLLAGVLVVALVTFGQHLGATPSFDESWHLAMTVGHGSPIGRFTHGVIHPSLPAMTSLDAGAAPAWQVWTHLDGVPHPPFYFVLLRFWRNVVGDGFRTAQWLSVLGSVVGVGFTFAAGRLAMDRWAAVVSGLIVALAQTQNYLAQEVRPYGLSIALSAIAIFQLTQIEVRGPTRGRAIRLAAITLPLMLTHYFNLATAIAIGLLGLMRLRDHRGAFCATIAIAAAIFAAAWGPFALAQSRNLGPAGDYLRATHRDLPDELHYAIVAPMRLIVDRDVHVAPWTVIGGLLFVAPWLLARRLPSLLPWATWLALVVGLIALVDLVALRTHLWMIRYAASATPAVALLFVGVGWAIDRRAAYAIGGTICVAGAVFLFTNGGTTSECADFTATLRAVAQRATPGEAIIAYGGNAQPFYGDVAILTASREPSLVGRPFLIVDGPIATELPSRVWLLSGDETIAPDRILPGARIIDHVTRDLGLTAYELDIGQFPATVPATHMKGRP